MAARGKIPISAKGWFAVRVPLAPISDFTDWTKGTPFGALDGDQAAASQLEAQQELLRARLRNYMSSPSAREALFVASPDLERVVRPSDAAITPADRERADRALIRYFARMTSRPTPFGLFAGMGMGQIADRTRLEVPDLSKAFRRCARADMGYLSALCALLRADERLERKFTYRPNDSISRAADRIHYVVASDTGGHRSYRLEAVDVSEYLDCVLKSAENGCSFDGVVRAVIEAEPEASEEEATEFAREVIRSQLIVPDLGVQVTGSDPLQAFIENLGAIDPAAATLSPLREVQAKLQQLNTELIGVGAEQYDSIAAHMVEAGVEVRAGRTFQVDSWIDMDGGATLGTAVVEEVKRAADCLRQIAPAVPDPLAGFKEAFSKRYELQEVPLLEALDEDVGIGFPPPSDTHNLQVTRNNSRRRASIAALLVEAASAGAYEVEITDEIVRRLRIGEGPSFPSSFAALVNVAAERQDELDAGRFVVVLNAFTGNSGASWLGRFSHLDAKLAEHVRRLLEEDDAGHPDAIVAEVVHLPQGRIGNVIARPALRAYEIPYLGGSGLSHDRRIRLDDLVVSVIDNEVRLHSRSLGRRVLPRLTSAHNASAPQNLTLYRFLTSLSQQTDRPLYAWSWGELDSVPFLPRITCGRSVLAEAMWRIEPAEAKRIRDKTSVHARLSASVEWRERRRIPRFVQVSEWDNRLTIDLENPLSLDVLLDIAHRRPTQIIELLPLPSQLGAYGGERPHLAEFLIPFAAVRPEKQGPAAEKQWRQGAAPAHVPRRFLPGSEWVYIKLYTGSGTIDRLLCDAIAPLVAQVRQSVLVDSWFFIRYADPEPHLRVRFHLAGGATANDLLGAAHGAIAPFVQDGRVWKVQLDTYEREVERYGGSELMLLSERLFEADSDCALSLIQENQDAGAWADRDLAILTGIDALMNDTGLDVSQRRDLLRGLRPLSKQQRTSWSQVYRSVRERIAKALDESTPAHERGFAPVEALSIRSKIAGTILPQLFSQPDLATAPTSEAPGIGRLLSYTHMFVNRMSRAGSAVSERQFYDALLLYYQSVIARRGANSASSVQPTGKD